MSYQYNQVLDSVLLRTVYFTTPANAPISSQYTLYANGFGQAYLSNAVLPANLSTLSTSIANTDSNVAVLSTQVSTLTYSLNSSISSLSYEITSTAQYTQDASNALAAQAYAFYESSLNIIYSTVSGFSNYSTSYSEISAVQSSVNANFSTLSTYITNQNISTYGALSQDAAYSTSVYAISTTAYVDAQISSVSSIYATISNLSTLSSVSARQLISTSAGLTSSITNLSTFVFRSITGTNTSTTSSLNVLFSTTTGHGQELTNLESMSTNMSSITASFYNPAISTSQNNQELSTATTFHYYSTFVGQNTAEITLISSFVYPYASTNNVNLSSINTNLSNVSSSLSSLWWEFNLLTTSSILSSIYWSFYNLEIYSCNLINEVASSVPSTLSSLAYSTFTQNTSTSFGFFNYYVSTLYASTLSTLIPSTIAFTSSLMSTLYSTGYYLFESTIASTILSTLYSTNEAYLNSIEPGIILRTESSLATQQNVYLSTTNNVALLDFNTYRNFNIYLQAPTDPNIYRITYLSNALSNKDYTTGVITIDISTINRAYSTNSSQLSLETYHWGYPTFVGEQFIPTISNTDYTIQYEYTILNQVLYTSLLNVYPRTAIRSITATTSGSNSVYIGNTPQTNGFWPNASVTVNWVPYRFFPFTEIKGPAYNPPILVDVLVNNSTVGTSGPFLLTQSTATIRIPPISYTGSNVVSTTLLAYIGGKKASGRTLSGFTVLPTFATLTLSNASSIAYIGGNSLTAFNLLGQSVLTPAMAITMSTTSGGSNYNNTVTYAASNMLNNNPNLNFVGPRTVAPDTRAAAIISTLLVTPLSSLAYSTFGTSVSAFAPASMSQFQTIEGVVFEGGRRYTRQFPLTSSTRTVFSL